MKRIFNTSLLLLTLWGLTACSMDKMGGTEDPADKTDPNAVGYLQLGTLTVNTDTEVSEIGSRAGESIDIKTYEVSIRDAKSGEPVKGTLDGVELGETFTFGQLEGEKAIALRPGTYTIEAHTPGRALSTSQTPWYTGKTSVTVTAANTQQNPAHAHITCKLGTIRVTVELSADLKKYFKKYPEQSDRRTRTRVNIAGNIVDFQMDATRYEPVWYFRDEAGDAAEGNTMKITLMGEFYMGSPSDLVSGNINENYYEWIEYEKTVTGVKAGTYRDIQISIDYNSTGNLEFTVNIQSYVYDDEITVDASSSLSGSMEPTIPDDSGSGGGSDTPAGPAPTIEWVGGNIDQRVTLNDSNKDSMSCVIKVSSIGLKNLLVDIDSDVLTDDELSSVGLKQHFDLTAPGDLVTNLQLLGFLPNGKTSLAGDKEVQFDITQFLSLLYKVYHESGNCDFKLTAVDLNGSTTKTVMFYIEK